MARRCDANRGGDGDLERTDRGDEDDGGVERSDSGEDGVDDTSGADRDTPSIFEAIEFLNRQINGLKGKRYWRPKWWKGRRR